MMVWYFKRDELHRVDRRHRQRGRLTEAFDTFVDNVDLHLKNIYRDKELEEATATEDSSVVRKEAKQRSAAFLFVDFLHRTDA